MKLENFKKAFGAISKENPYWLNQKIYDCYKRQIENMKTENLSKAKTESLDDWLSNEYTKLMNY